MSKFKQFLNGLKQGSKMFGESIASIINTILLLVVYFIGVGITYLIAKISRKHFLDLQTSDKKTTYWSDLNLSKKPTEDYYRQF